MSAARSAHRMADLEQETFEFDSVFRMQSKSPAHAGAEASGTSGARNLHAVRFGPGGSPKLGEPRLPAIGTCSSTSNPDAECEGRFTLV